MTLGNASSLFHYTGERSAGNYSLWTWHGQSCHGHVWKEDTAGVYHPPQLRTVLFLLSLLPGSMTKPACSDHRMTSQVWL